MKAALIQNGTVVNFIEVPHGYVPPEGHQMVFTEVAAPGHKYDGEKFIDPTVTSMEDLMTHAHNRLIDVPYFPIKFTSNGVSKVMTFFWKDMDYLDRVSKRAAKDSTLSIKYANPRTGEVVTLDNGQVLALHAALEDFIFEQKDVYAELIDAIHAKKIKTHYEVDHPPGNMKKWPPRHDEPLV